MNAKSFLLFTVACASAVHGAPSTSANYTVLPETLDGGGRRSTSTNYTHDGCAGLVAGISSVASPQQTARTGYVGQLYDVTSLAVSASPTTVNEMASRQLSASQVLDDASTLAVSASSVAWSVVTGPVSSVSATGLATAGPVFQDTTATVQGSLTGLSGTLNLTVFNSLPDNYGSYAGDGINDTWQYDFFGLNNPNAAPERDPDGDAQDNQFEYLAGLIPTDAASRFKVAAAPVPGQPTRMKIIFSPCWPDRSYTVVTGNLLDPAGWAPLTGSSVSNNGNERTVTDLNATAPRKFYRVEIEGP